jgi:pimeloyl-ACP methyl ester carboxylesterase
MARFSSFDGTHIAYVEDGDPGGPPVLLHHGFASDSTGNWIGPGVVKALAAAGRRVVAIDARGHGASDKPHDPKAYEDSAMARDVRALLDHLAIDAIDVVGYSMGSFVAASLVPDEPRARSLILGGVGAGLLDGGRTRAMAAVADALEADDPSTIPDATARGFRIFAESTGADRFALAAIQRADRRHETTRLGDIRVPTLVLVGDKDALVGAPQPLADAIPGASVTVVTGDHLSAVGDPAFTQAIVDFLAKVSPI